ncbi:MAG: transport-associated protein [Elusimicrobia bacterium RIFOXYD2_FULL_34_15]|nr:MAG: transport-associated protein [Elusimicrobia bacterium RIFOXYD2_FULL_34_15]
MTSASVRTLHASLASETDNRIESSAKDSYVFKTYLKDDSVSIQSKNGVVTLKGTIKEESHKSLAQETVASLPGVKKVNNQLVYKGEHQTENSDGWIGIKVKTTILFHKNLNVFKTEVDVKDGVVTLKGEASSQAQKELAGEYAKDVVGVKDVKNDMTVAKNPNNTEQTLGEKIDDASITAQVKRALLFHRSTGAIKTKVSTNNGVVTLHGIAKNGAEKSLVGKLAEDIKGVTNVVNDMTIAKK